MIGTYVHGPLLPKNPWLSDWLIGAALRAARHRRSSWSRWTTALELEAQRVAAAIAAA